ncbi:hypothetical protein CHINAEXTREME_09525 [Halobiforma lacisalsi AJ5]|uniref:Uncharacterized protein n=1 Tax=Natronobacterium lacisalsi AJ5 TaxID=358396 RepID=M0L9G9_NATLA|nr:hypothetical protein CHINAEXTREME_09525 [Halobiforma lacisalsi AJ5]EMA28560.1 hypothetical protein C445_18086 [Halobiforma lacisalsi AJ5]
MAHLTDRANPTETRYFLSDATNVAPFAFCQSDRGRLRTRVSLRADRSAAVIGSCVTWRDGTTGVLMPRFGPLEGETNGFRSVSRQVRTAGVSTGHNGIETARSSARPRSVHAAVRSTRRSGR